MVFPKARAWHEKGRTVTRSPSLEKIFGEKLSQTFEGLLDSVEVRHVLGMLLGFGILDDAFFIDDEGRALRHATHDEVGVGEEAFVSHVVGRSSLVLVVGEEGQLDAFLLGPLRLRERVVAGDADHGGVELGVFVELVGDGAELGGAASGEGHGNEEKDDVGLPDVLGKSEEFRAFRAFGDEGEIGGFSSSCKCHSSIS